MWRVEASPQWTKDEKRYSKKHPREMEAMLNNVDRYMAQIQISKNARCVQAGYLHREPMGVVAVDQKGGGPSLMESRMYTYADEGSKVLYLITIGNKNEQQSDLKFCKVFVQENFPPERA